MIAEAAAPADETSLRYPGWRVAGASATGVFFASVVIYGFAVLLKPLSAEFAWSRETAATAYACLALASALGAPVVGRLLDRYGSARVSVPCLAISGLGVAAISMLSGSRAELYVLFTVIGLAVTGTTPLAYSRAVSTWFERRRGQALAVVIAGGSVGAIVHPPFVDTVTAAMGWRGACLAIGVVTAAAGIPLIAAFVRENAAHAHAPPSATVRVTTGGALHSHVFWILVIVAALGSLAYSAVAVHLIALLTDRGVEPGRAAMVLSLVGGAGLAGRLLTGWLIDRWRATYVSAGVLTMASIGLGMLAMASSLPIAVIAAVLIGFGVGGELDVTPFLLSRYFGLRSLSTLYGVAWTAIGGGAAAGSVLMGRAFDASGSYDGALLELAAATSIAAITMLTLPPYRLHQPEQPVSGDLLESKQLS